MPEITEAESFRRGVFSYEADGVVRIGDPLRIMNRMYVAVDDFEGLVDQFFAPPTEDEDTQARDRRNRASFEAAEKLEPAILAGFRLQPLADDGSGVSLTEAMEILADFIGWQARKEAARAALLEPTPVLCHRCGKAIEETGTADEAGRPVHIHCYHESTDPDATAFL